MLVPDGVPVNLISSLEELAAELRGAYGRPGKVGGSSSKPTADVATGSKQWMKVNNLMPISDIGDKDIEQKVRTICEQNNFPYEKVFMSKTVSTNQGSFTTGSDFVVLTPFAMGEMLGGVLTHEIAHAQSAPVLMKYFQEREAGGGDIFKLLSGKVSDVIGDDGYFTEYIKHFSKNFEEAPTIRNRLLYVMEGYAESRRMEYEGKAYPQSWKDLHIAIMDIK